MFEIEIEGLEELKVSLEATAIDIDAALEDGVNELTLGMQAEAQRICTEDTGQLRNSIIAKVEKKDGGYSGAVGTNVKHGPYVEFGTGPRGEKTPVPDKYPGQITYRQTPWWIPESRLSSAARKKYRWFKLQIGDEVFYRSSGQAAQPFLYPAFLEYRKHAAEIIAERIKEGTGLG